MGSIRGDSVSTQSRPLLLGAIQSEVDPNRSPLGSPPIVKKRLRRLSNAWLESSTVNSQNRSLSMKGATLIQPCSRCEAQNDKLCERLTIDTSYQTMDNDRLSQSPSILKKRNVSPKCSHKRHVQFKGNITLHIVCPDGSHLATEQENLHSGPRDREAFISRNINRKIAKNNSPPSFSSQSRKIVLTRQQVSPSDHLERLEASKRSSVPLGEISQNDSRNPLPGSNVSITFTQDSKYGTKLKFVVFLGADFDPDNIVVKANMNGSRIRVIASRFVSASGSQSVEQFNERYVLPMDVDPFAVEARLDNKGILTVEAPLASPKTESEL